MKQETGRRQPGIPSLQGGEDVKPPHVAPLDMIYYEGNALPGLEGKLLVSWHGYLPVGNRVVSYAVDDDGLPVLTNPVWYWQDSAQPKTAPRKLKFQPRGGSEQDAQHQEIIHHWNKVPGLRPKGSPVGLHTLSDGTLVIVDDRNAALLRLAPGTPYRGDDDDL